MTHGQVEFGRAGPSIRIRPIAEEPLPENTSRVEVHGCIVCGRLHDLLIVTNTAGKLVGYTPTGSGCHALPGSDRLRVTCDEHTAKQVEAALARQHPEAASSNDPEED